MQRQPVYSRQQASHKLIERLLAEHDIALRRFIRVRLGAQQDCDDVLQEVYVRLSQIDDLPEKLADRLDTARNYLMQIASNLLIDRARRAQVRHAEKHISTDDVETYSTLNAPDRDLHNKRQLQQVEAALAKIKSVHRQAFLLHRVEGLSYREIGDQLGISVSTVEKYISSALLAVRQALLSDAEAHS
ncbi:RNA polymerase sigma factor [Pseudidiomarina aestuarii]|uniref:RNA polymerase sigma factor n=1 Tax=Pseudidiomarina aestuarii TaxID=624146 RepID=UPI003A9883CE